MDILDELVMVKWAENGLTAKDIKKFIKKADFDALLLGPPILAFLGPYYAAKALKKVTSIQDTEMERKQRQRKKLMDIFMEEQRMKGEIEESQKAFDPYV